MEKYYSSIGYSGENDIRHYGIQGQKWGVRRFQNEDGTLTTEGRERYGNKKEHPDKGFIRKTVGSEFGGYAFAKWRERRHNKNLAKAEARGNQKAIEKYKSKKEAQSAANANLDAYRKHHSAASLTAQNLLITAPAFRHARARGESVISSLIESNTPIGPILRMFRDKNAYGKYVVYGVNQNGRNDSKTGGKWDKAIRDVDSILDSKDKRVRDAYTAEERKKLLDWRNEIASKNGIEQRSGSIKITKNNDGKYQLHSKDLDKKTRDRILDNHSRSELKELTSHLKSEVTKYLKTELDWDISKESFVKDIDNKPLEDQLYFYAQFFNMEDYF